MYRTLPLSLKSVNEQFICGFVFILFFMFGKIKQILSRKCVRIGNSYPFISEQIMPAYITKTVRCSLLSLLPGSSPLLFALGGFSMRESAKSSSAKRDRLENVCTKIFWNFIFSYFHSGQITIKLLVLIKNKMEAFSLLRLTLGDN